MVCHAQMGAVMILQESRVMYIETLNSGIWVKAAGIS